MPTGGVPSTPVVCDICNAISGVSHIYYTRWQAACYCNYHASLRLRERVPTLPDRPSSATLPPRGTRGLRASPLPGRVPLLIVSRMRYVDAIHQRNLMGCLGQWREECMGTCRLGVSNCIQCIQFHTLWQYAPPAPV